MSKLNDDVLFLIIEKLQYDINSLFSCLLVNKTWCEVIIPILWKNPLGYNLIKEKEKSQLNVIISHLSSEVKENTINQGINLSTVTQRKPLFNYISYCRYLELFVLGQRTSIIEDTQQF